MNWQALGGDHRGVLLVGHGTKSLTFVIFDEEGRHMTTIVNEDVDKLLSIATEAVKTW